MDIFVKTYSNTILFMVETAMKLGWEIYFGFKFNELYRYDTLNILSNYIHNYEKSKESQAYMSGKNMSNMNHILISYSL